MKHVTFFFPPRKKRNFEKYDCREFRCSGVWCCVVGLVVPGISNVRRSHLTSPHSRSLSLATLFLELQISQVSLSLIFIEKLLSCISQFHNRHQTNSMQHSPSREANRSSDSQEIPGILRNPLVPYHVHKCPPPSLSWVGQIQPMPPHLTT